MDEKELLEIIENAAKEKETTLDLSGNQLTELPPEIGQLTHLTELNLSRNQLSELPPEIGQLTHLTTLNLNANQLTELPPEIGQLTQLTELNLDDNQLNELPPEICQLSNLTTLDLDRNQLSVLPPEICQLTHLASLDLRRNQLGQFPLEIVQLSQLTQLYLEDNQLGQFPLEIVQLPQLTTLDLGNNQLSQLSPEIVQLPQLINLYLENNQLSELPPEICQLTQLITLWLYGNQLTQLPLELHQLEALTELDVSNNPALRFPPQEIVALGVEGIKNFLRAAHAGNEPVWESKLLLIGEGGVGKTSVFNALNGKLLGGKPEPGTVGIDIGDLYLPHPSEPEVKMHLNCWDFAGQDFNHATHQFFFSNRTLFLLVWNARHGWQQGKLYRWLENVKVRAPEAKVILVHTHIDQPHSGYPFDELQRKYPQIVGEAAVSNETGDGIDELRELIRQHAADLPLMGLRWPQTWLKAANSIRALRDEDGEEHTSRRTLHSLMEAHGLNEAECCILMGWLHELGDILHFDDEPELRDRVILQPEWLTKHVGVVLRSDEVANQDGILTRPHLENDLWPELDDYLREHFLRLMDKFDLAYLIPDDPEDRSLIVERLPLNAPNYQEPWDEFKDSGHEIQLRFRLGSMQPGIPTWFIARCHRFTMRIHWLNGVLFRDEDDRHRALIIADDQHNTVDMTVRGPFPQRFMTLLRDGFRDTLKRYKGLKVELHVPCIGGDNDLVEGDCPNEFDLANLENWLIKRPNNTQFECPQCGTELSRLELVEGIGATALTQDFTAERISEMIQAQHKKTRDEIKHHIDRRYDDMIAYEKRNFLLAWQREQERELVTCPNLFTIREWGRSGLFTDGQLRLQLYCQYHKGWHSIRPDGLYDVSQTREWFKKALPYLLTLHKIMKVLVPLGAAALSVAGDASAWAKSEHKVFENDFKLMDEMLKQVDKLPMEVEPLGEMVQAAEARPTFRKYKDAELVPIRELMDGLAEQDKAKNRAKWGGLTRRQTPEGDILWLCGEHLTEYESRRKPVPAPPG